MKRISRKRALILARKYDRIARALHVDACAASALPIKAELPIENARRRIAEAVCVLNDYANGRIR
jgi:hypothetical protein